MSTALALPDPERLAIARVKAELIPASRAWRDAARESADIAAAQHLADVLAAFRGFLRNREGRDLVTAEERRTEVLIGELLGPAPVPGVDVGRGRELVSATTDTNALTRTARSEFRQLAEQADRVEELLAQGVIARRAILDKLAMPASAMAADGTRLREPLSGTFRTIVADPPWRYGNSGTRANAAGHYDGTLTVEQLCGREPLPDGGKLTDQIENWRADDAHLYLWTTAAFLREAFDVMDAWGFTYKTFLAWVKPQMGMGNYFRVSSELVLFGIRGRLPIEHRGLKNWFEAKRGKHSAKPPAFFDLVAKASPGPHLEMFSRCYATGAIPGACQCSKCSRGWEVWGNGA